MPSSLDDAFVALELAGLIVDWTPVTATYSVRCEGYAEPIFSFSEREGLTHPEQVAELALTKGP